MYKIIIKGIVVLLLILSVVACAMQENATTGGDVAAPTQANATEPINAPVDSSTGSGRVFTIQPNESTASYEVQEEFFGRGIATSSGSTGQVEGQIALTIDADNGTVALGQNQITVNIETLTSDEARRDNRIRAEWLQSSTYPIATFVATDIQGFPANAAEGEPVTFQLIGDLTVREITNQVTFTTTAILQGNTLSGNAETLVYMRDYGFEPPAVADFLAVTDGVTVKLNFVAIES